MNEYYKNIEKYTLFHKILIWYPSLLYAIFYETHRSSKVS